MSVTREQYEYGSPRTWPSQAMRAKPGIHGTSQIVLGSPILSQRKLRQILASDDVAEAIEFLLNGERGGFINGVSLPVDGGWTADASWESLRLRTRS